MRHYVVDPYNTSATVMDASGCQTCCCATHHVKAGETNPMVINYAGWAVPFARKGLDCSPQYVIEQLKACPPSTGTNLPPTQLTPISYDVPFAPHNVPVPVYNNSLVPNVFDPENDPATFALLPFYSTKHGKLTLDAATGAFTFFPQAGYNGLDRFFFTVSDGTNKPVVMEAVFRIGNTTAATYTEKVSVEAVHVDQYNYMTTYLLSVSPATLPCEVFRMTVKQGALDCDCNCSTRIDCFDLIVGKC